MKILIVDDEPAILQIYGDKLKASGYEVVTAADGVQAMAKAKSDKPDLILLDIIMPKINGLDVLKDLKTEETTNAIPVILLTNLPAEMSEEKARNLGAADYYVKAEYDPSTVVNIVQKNFSGNQPTEAQPQPDQPTVNPNDPQPQPASDQPPTQPTVQPPTQPPTA